MVAALRIALGTYSTRARGGVVHTLALAEALARSGQDVTVWALSRGADRSFFRPVAPRVAVRVVPMDEREGEPFGERVMRSISTLGEAFERALKDGDHYDVVHAQDCITANALPALIRTVHHLDTFTTPELVACHERALVLPPHHICVSQAVAAELRAGWGIEAAVIGNGVDASRFAAAAGPGEVAQARRQAWRERLGGRPLVVTIGGIEPRKGTLDLVHALALLRVRRPGAVLAVGGGETLFDYRPYRAAVDARSAELEVSPVILGPLTDEELPALVAAADVFAFPSTKEGFGLAAMEALAAGVPVVVSDLPVFHEVFGDTVTYATDAAGLAEALEAAAQAGPEAADRRARGRALAARHTWADAAQAHLDFYRAILR